MGIHDSTAINKTITDVYANLFYVGIREVDLGKTKAINLRNEKGIWEGDIIRSLIYPFFFLGVI